MSEVTEFFTEWLPRAKKLFCYDLQYFVPYLDHIQTAWGPSFCYFHFIFASTYQKWLKLSLSDYPGSIKYFAFHIDFIWPNLHQDLTFESNVELYLYFCLKLNLEFDHDLYLGLGLGLDLDLVLYLDLEHAIAFDIDVNFDYRFA